VSRSKKGKIYPKERKQENKFHVIKDDAVNQKPDTYSIDYVDPEPGVKKAQDSGTGSAKSDLEWPDEKNKGINFASKSWMFSSKAGGLWKSFTEA
jgi:hypothetical protein